MYDIDLLWGKKLNDDVALERADYIKKHYIDEGKMGIKSGQGFYSYPNPSYAEADFLK
jgi:3-hydroxybutyryl-CoA dehydrogenase